MEINFSVIIPNFNGAKFLSECLKNLHISAKNCSNSKFEIILVDNGSVDNSLKIFKNFSNKLVISNLSFTIIRLPSNYGFAFAVNQGIKAAKYNYVCLLNNDLILEKKFFNLIKNEINKKPQYACFCGTVLNKDGTQIESQGISFDWSGKCLQNHFSTTQLSNYSSKLVWGSSGAVVIYNKEIILKIGLFDEHYFAYIEDVDVAFRLQKNHYQTLLVPQAVSYHLGGGTSNKMGNFRAKQTFKNWIYFIKKNYSLSQTLKYFPQIFIERLRNLSYLLKSTINK